MPISEAKQRADIKWKKNNYDFFNLHFPKGKKDLVKKAADAAGLSINSFINAAIDKALADAGYITIDNNK